MEAPTKFDLEQALIDAHSAQIRAEIERLEGKRKIVECVSLAQRSKLEAEEVERIADIERSLANQRLALARKDAEHAESVLNEMKDKHENPYKRDTL